MRVATVGAECFESNRMYAMVTMVSVVAVTIVSIWVLSTRATYFVAALYGFLSAMELGYGGMGMIAAAVAAPLALFLLLELLLQAAARFPWLMIPHLLLVCAPSFLLGFHQARVYITAPEQGGSETLGVVVGGVVGTLLAVAAYAAYFRDRRSLADDNGY